MVWRTLKRLRWHKFRLPKWLIFSFVWCVCKEWARTTYSYIGGRGIFHSYTHTLGAVSLAALWTSVSCRGRFNMLTAWVQDGIPSTLVSGWMLCHLSHIWPKRKGPASAVHCIALCRLWPVIQESIHIQSCSLVLMPSRLLRSWQFVPVRAVWVSPSEIRCFELCCGGNVACCLPITGRIEGEVGVKWG